MDYGATASRVEPLQNRSVSNTIGSANEMLEDHLKRLHALMARIRGSTPEMTAGSVSPPSRIGPMPLMELLERNTRLHNECQAVMSSLEDFV